MNKLVGLHLYNALKNTLELRCRLYSDCFLLGQRVAGALDETLLDKPVGGLGGEHEYPVQPLAPGFLFQFFQQPLAALAAAVIGVGNDAGDFAAALLGRRDRARRRR